MTWNSEGFEVVEKWWFPQKVEARKLQKRLEHLGAQPFFRLGLGDDQHDFGSDLRKLKVDPVRPLHSHKQRNVWWHVTNVRCHKQRLHILRLLMALALQKVFACDLWCSVTLLMLSGMEQELASQLHAFLQLLHESMDWCHRGALGRWTSEDPWCESMWQALATKVSPGIPDEDVDLRYEARGWWPHCELGSFVIFFDKLGMDGVWMGVGSHLC